MAKVSALTTYVDRKNTFGKLFNSKFTELSLQIAADRQRIANMIDAELSPENLTCDGELSRSAVNAKYKMLTRAAQELQSIDSTVTFYEFN